MGRNKELTFFINNCKPILLIILNTDVIIKEQTIYTKPNLTQNLEIYD